MPKEIMIEFQSPCGKYRLTFDDDGRVAYAYLKYGGEIIGDVWLYNRCPTPKQPEWTDREKIPFANCAGYMSEKGNMTRRIASRDVKVRWEYGDQGLVAFIYVFDDLYGVVAPQDKPGYARFAIKDNRLARAMEIEDGAPRE